MWRTTLHLSRRYSCFTLLRTAWRYTPSLSPLVHFNSAQCRSPLHIFVGRGATTRFCSSSTSRVPSHGLIPVTNTTLQKQEEQSQVFSISLSERMMAITDVARDLPKLEEEYTTRLANSEANFGKDNPAIIPCANELASIYAIQGRFHQSYQMHKRILAIYMNQEGKHNLPLLLSGLSGLSLFFHRVIVLACTRYCYSPRSCNNLSNRYSPRRHGEPPRCWGLLRTNVRTARWMYWSTIRSTNRTRKSRSKDAKWPQLRLQSKSLHSLWKPRFVYPILSILYILLPFFVSFASFSFLSLIV